MVKISAISKLLGLTCLLGASLAAHAQAYPSRPITMVVGFAAGGGTDIAARMVAKDLAVELGQPVVVENRAGAGGAIGASAVAKAQPDGYTLFFGSGSELTLLPNVRKSPPYDTLKQFESVSLIGKVSFMLVAHPAVPANNVGELVALAKSKPGAVSFASYGLGSTNHLIGELFAMRTGTQLLHVPYKGSAAAATDLVSGQVNIGFDTVSVMMPQVKAGKLKGLGVLSPTRSQLVPDMPTLGEGGVKDFVVEGWMGVLAPANTPLPVVNRLAQAIQKVMAKPEMVDAFRQRGVQADPLSPKQFRVFLVNELNRWQHVVKTANIQVE